jgi:hypothetical protein
MYDERLAGGKVQSDLHGAAETHAGLMELWLVHCHIHGAAEAHAGLTRNPTSRICLIVDKATTNIGITDEDPRVLQMSLLPHRQ